MKSKPIIGISMGDPAGIGPEIIAKALAREHVHQICRPLVVGDPGIMERAVGFAGVRLAIHRIARTSEARFQPTAIDVLALDGIDLSGLRVGLISADAGDAAFRAVSKVIELALSGEIDATVTAPIHKEALVRAGHHFPGHTEIFAHFTGTRDFTMMLAAENFRVVHVSTHMSLRDACNAVTRDRVLKVINLAHDACRQLGIAKSPHRRCRPESPRQRRWPLRNGRDRSHHSRDQATLAQADSMSTAPTPRTLSSPRR